MSKLIDTAKLARLAKALDDRAKALVEVEKQRAMDAEAALQAEIDAINHEETGILARAKKYADDQDVVLKGFVEGEVERIDGELEGVGNRLDGIDAEQDQQDAKIKANEDAIAAINHAETGILAQAKKYADDQDAVLRGEVEEEIQRIDGDIDGLEAAVKDIQDEQDVQDGKIKANEDALAILNGDENTEGSVKKQIKDAIDEVNEVAANLDERVTAIEAEQIVQNENIQKAQDAADKAQGEVDAVEERMLAAEGRLDDIEAEQTTQNASIEALEGRMDTAEGDIDSLEGRMLAAEGKIDVLNGGDDVEGSVAKAVKDAVDPVQADLDALEAVVGAPADGEVPATGLHKIVVDGDAKTLEDAKKYADAQITALVDSAPEAMNTLNELAKAITDHEDVYQAYVQHVAAELEKKVDKIENHRLVSETEIAAWNAKAEVADVEQALKDAKEYTDQEIAKVEEDMEALEGRVESLEEKVGHDVNGNDPATGLFLEVDQARAAADQAQQEVDAVEGRMDTAEGEIDAIQAEQLTQNADIKANKEALAILNGGAEVEGSVAHSIAEALEPYSTTEEMKAIIGNVVQSLALTMENDKVVLKLGGAEGIQLTSVSLDMATDADIDSIVNGLDAE